MPKLGVNIDHIATLRQVRKAREPEPVWAAAICELAGCDGIVAHLREDRRHINERDVRLLKDTVKTKLNLEMSIAKEIVNIAVRIKPNQATLVPEKRQELTTEGGLDIISGKDKIAKAVRALKDKGIEVSLFIDPDKRQIEAAKKIGADLIELHTGKFANGQNKKETGFRLKELKDATRFAKEAGLCVAAGHGLNYSNAGDVAGIAGIEELNIGHSIIARAVFVGLECAVREMLKIVKGEKTALSRPVT